MSGVDATILIAEYDESWPRRFAEERELLASVLRPWLMGPIEHIGSTAVPGLAAKPVIDIMAGVASLDASRPALEALAAHGYCYAPYRAGAMHWFCKPGPEVRTHHLHLVPVASELGNERLAFRDLLRRDAGVAREYEALKRRLAAAHPDDREEYTDAKGPFIAAAIGRRTRPLE